MWSCWWEALAWAAAEGKDCGLGRFPSYDFGINSACLTASLTAATLLSWLRLIALDGDLARAEPKTLRYRILHAAPEYQPSTEPQDAVRGVEKLLTAAKVGARQPHRTARNR